MARKEKYFSPTPYGTRASIRIDGQLYQKHFKTGTDPVDMRQWIVDTEIAHRSPTLIGSFKADAEHYLTTVSAMTSYSDRKRDIEAWVSVFGDRQRSTITSAEIAAALHKWRETLSASSCNSRRAALQHLWTRLDGRGAKNPVRDVPKFALPELAPRALDYPTIRKILRKVPHGPDRARLMMLAFVGLPHKVIGQLTAANFNAEALTLSVPGRRKGAGSKGRVLPLSPDGVRAVKLMASTDAWGPFPRYHLRYVFHQACEACGITEPPRVYDLRHSFGTEVYRKSGDTGAVTELMLHSGPAMARRYTLAAVSDRARKALRGFGR